MKPIIIAGLVPTHMVIVKIRNRYPFLTYGHSPTLEHTTWQVEKEVDFSPCLPPWSYILVQKNNLHTTLKIN